MRKILISSHGEFAKGLENTLKMFAGDTICVASICAYIDDLDPETEFGKFLEKTDSEDEILAFTDIMGGSVNRVLNQYRMEGKCPEHFHLIAGTNLPLILELALYKTDSYLSEEDIAEKINTYSNDSHMVFPFYSSRSLRSGAYEFI